MTTETRPAHSPLGASSAERWMNCVGSVALLKNFKLPESDEPEYRSKGTSAHEAIHVCFTQGLDAWEVVGQQHGKHEVDVEIADAIQVFIDECRGIMRDNPGGVMYVEFGVDAPDFHKFFYGTLDWGYVLGPRMWIRDYKHGEGIAVDVIENPQIKYYTYGLLRHHPEVTEIDLGIVQPRIVYLEPVRLWETTAENIRTWAEGELLDAMNATALDGDLNAGDWCRFCPAKLVCPLMVSLYGAAMQTDPKQIINLSEESLGRSYHYLAAVKHYIGAFEAEVFLRLNLGTDIPGTKLVYKKARRVWKTGAAELMREQFADKAIEPAKLKSPAEIEKIGPAAKKLVHEWAYTPQSGLTVASADDNRTAVRVQSTSEAFPSEVLDNATASE